MKSFNKKYKRGGGGSESFAAIVVLFIVLLFVMYVTCVDRDHSKYMIDGKFFKIHNAYENKYEALKTMAEIDRRIEILIKNPAIIKKYPEIVKKYSRDKIIENSPHNSDKTTSYVDDKNMALCIRDEYGNVHDVNTLMFVALHELSHYVTISGEDHGGPFWVIFRDILFIAKNEKIIELINYREYPIKYCGILIDHNPAENGRD